ncbi:hypothetical protein TruAng_010447 [Truncatella angustata]|nr:hypothetical protein TruAng_010447 [Truncatella angustata]
MDECNQHKLQHVDDRDCFQCPTRLVYVGSEASNDTQIRLVSPPAGFTASYLTLSYCWGNVSHNLRTTAVNVREFHRSIPWESLPGTVREAIVFTRKFGVQYIWIDALCIIQASSSEETSADWIRESGRIGLYYQNAKLTLAASAATDCNQGLVLSRPAVKHRPGFLVIDIGGGGFIKVCISSKQYPSREETITSSRLLSRGWVTQELMFSRRIVTFSQHGLYWDCATSSADEFGNHTHGSRLDIRAFLLQSRNVLLGRTWNIFVGDYSRTSFTFESDRLVAITSIMARIAETTGATPVYGLWKQTLAYGLAWYNDGNKYQERTRPALAPSWSWASVNCGITYDYTAHKPSIKAEIYWPSTVRHNDFRLLVQGRTFQWRAKNMVKIFPKDWRVQLSVDLTIGTCEIWLDSMREVNFIPEAFTYLVLLSKAISTYCLILQDTGIDQSQNIRRYRRVGMADFKCAGWDIGDAMGARRQKVQLI